MLGENAFYYEMIKKYIVAFGCLFNDIHVLRTDKENNTIKDIKVPITFAEKQKVAYQINNINSRSNDFYSISSIIPRLSYMLNSSIEFDSQRVLNPILKRTNRINTDGVNNEIGVGRPFNFAFQLSIWTKYLDDMFQIIEQVLSFFHPDYHLTIKEIPELDIESSVPVVFQSCSPNFENEFGEQGQRVLKFDMDFIVKGWIYPPIKNAQILENIRVKINDYDSDENISTIRNEFDDDVNKYYSAILEKIDPYYEEKIDAPASELEDVSQVVLNVYKSEEMPVLPEDIYEAYWFDTKNGFRYFLKKDNEGNVEKILL